MSLLAHLQCMPYLTRLYYLDTTRFADDLAHPTPKEHFSLTRLTCFHYHGPSAFLTTLVASFSAPSLCDAIIRLRDVFPSQIPHFPRFIDDLGKEGLPLF